MSRFIEENMGGMFPYFRVDPTTAITALVLAVTLGAARRSRARHSGRQALGGQRAQARGIGREHGTDLATTCRSLAVRKTTTLATGLGIGLVVFVFAAVMMLGAGIEKTLASTRTRRLRHRHAQGRGRRALERHRHAQRRPHPGRPRKSSGARTARPTASAKWWS